MVLEQAVLEVRPGTEQEFEAAFAKAQAIIVGMPGYISHSLSACIEYAGRYLLLVEWESLEDHTQGFRQSPQYDEWRRLLHHFYEPFPEVTHYETVFAGASTDG